MRVWKDGLEQLLHGQKSELVNVREQRVMVAERGPRPHKRGRDLPTALGPITLQLNGPAPESPVILLLQHPQPERCCRVEGGVRGSLSGLDCGMHHCRSTGHSPLRQRWNVSGHPALSLFVLLSLPISSSHQSLLLLSSICWLNWFLYWKLPLRTDSFFRLTSRRPLLIWSHHLLYICHFATNIHHLKLARGTKPPGKKGPGIILQTSGKPWVRHMIMVISYFSLMQQTLHYGWMGGINMLFRKPSI